MEDTDINVFRGLMIMLLFIIIFMLVDSFLNVPFLTFGLSTISGLLILFTCKGIKRKNINIFRATFFTGIIFFLIGNFLLFRNINKYYYDAIAAYIVTLGFFLSAMGIIIMFSSIPLIIFKDIEEHHKRILSNSQRFE